MYNNNNYLLWGILWGPGLYEKDTMKNSELSPILKFTKVLDMG